MKKILFMGDSITDSSRVRDENNRFYMGEGYPCMCAGRIMKDHPAEYYVENVGIGGHRIVDIYARIKKDFWNLKPDIFSMFINVDSKMKPHRLSVTRYKKGLKTAQNR